MSEVKSKAFQSASKSALDDKGLQRLLGRVVHGFADLRDAAVEEVTEPVWEQLRERARSIKQQTLANLDYYLELVDKSVTRNGGHVHFAKDADEANKIVLEIAKRHDVKRVVKSKSMVSEEIGINQVLEANGIEPVETDLGEYIIQLAKETPFHIIAPALHKSKEQVSDLFHDWLKSQPTNEIEELCRTARDELRDKFATADMGITGANFIVAETGTVMLVTNEGNGRMTTSVPRVQVTLAGMEKVVPALEDLATFIRLLPRSATGQRISTYTTFVGGPRSATDEDGPEEFHLVLVDNGRMNVLKDPEMREVLQCIRCGACLNTCPVYQKVGGHAYGWVYSGPIGAILTPLLVGMDEGKELPFASSLCGACKDVFP
ncbi:MAG: LutB/LldF family L-lactate oxidation iron-sulfur protein, partial [Chloroflexi bacterium]|nr:LutB/LldF family L-lactate oxidation iron-sulfur protein [Chloroflexota bacterium]